MCFFLAEGYLSLLVSSLTRPTPTCLPSPSLPLWINLITNQWIKSLTVPRRSSVLLLLRHGQQRRDRSEDCIEDRQKDWWHMWSKSTTTTEAGMTTVLETTSTRWMISGIHRPLGHQLLCCFHPVQQIPPLDMIRIIKEMQGGIIHQENSVPSWSNMDAKDEPNAHVVSNGLLWNPQTTPQSLIQMGQSKNRYDNGTRLTGCEYTTRRAEHTLLGNCYPTIMNATKRKKEQKGIYIYKTYWRW